MRGSKSTKNIEITLPKEKEKNIEITKIKKKNLH